MPNRFWPATTSVRKTGNDIQQNTASNNPDIFCESQGSGYRLPSLGEFSAEHRSYNPWGPAANGVPPGHWSNYLENDITKARLPNVSSPNRTLGSVYSEWGNLDRYNNWSGDLGVTFFWVTEPSFSEFDGRTVFRPFDGSVLYAFTSYIQTRPYSQQYVACVRDLVPTPSTPNPGKS